MWVCAARCRRSRSLAIQVCWSCPRTASRKPSRLRSSRARRFCSFTAIVTISFHPKRCSKHQVDLPRLALRWSGISRKASVTALTKKACATAASSSSARSRAQGDDRNATEGLRVPAPLPAHVAAHAPLLHVAELAEHTSDEAAQLVVEPHRQADRLGTLEAR